MSYEPVEDTPVLSCLMAMTAASLERCDLSDREMMIARVSALIATGAPPASYALNAPAASESGLTLEDAQAVLVAVAPIVGAPRTLAGAGAMEEGLGLALAVTVAMLAEEDG